MKSLISSSVVFAVLLAAAFASATPLRSGSSSSSTYQRTVTGGVIEGAADPYYPGVGVWKGIPYAAAPTGANRFAPTQPVGNWTGVKNTTAWGAGCLQKCILPRPTQTCPSTYSEDCLFMNIFTPVPSGANATQPSLPVFFFVHGGAFISGAGGVPLYESAKLAETQNIVVVSINYRLGVFGALYMGEIAKGNFMLQDQRMGLQWVQDNIAQFGGDKSRVTLGGQSAGAMSTGAHLASPLSKGLFHGAIMSSNPYGLPFQHPRLAARLATDFLKNVSCEFGTQAGLECLRALPSDVIEVVGHATRNKATSAHALVSLVPWVPVALTEELPEQPLVAATSGKFHRVPILMGNNANDSVLFVNQISDKPLNNLEIDAAMAFIFGLDEAIEIKLLYGPPHNKVDSRIYFSRIGTDYMFYCPIRKAAGAFATFLANSSENGSPLNPTAPKKNVYEYQFNHLPSFSEWMWTGNMPLCEKEICHGDDLPFVFGSFYASPEMPNISMQESNLSGYMMDSYGTFIRNGNMDELNTRVGANGPQWPTYTSALNEFMAWMAPKSGPVQNYHEKYCAYWDSVGYKRE